MNISLISDVGFPSAGGNTSSRTRKENCPLVMPRVTVAWVSGKSQFMVRFCQRLAGRRRAGSWATEVAVSLSRNLVLVKSTLHRLPGEWPAKFPGAGGSFQGCAERAGLCLRFIRSKNC